ncbi:MULTISPECIES: hypothetical protein [Streptomyces]|uniref:hypothetical protein n=1 Tax=Streptomyces TaxID=1883 RepID=UPI0005B86630|nr:MULTISPECIES: hypothetical protein [Streptomyces]MDP9950953.1 hypothetical protein [Streptomyces sp. DSM 41269]
MSSSSDQQYPYPYEPRPQPYEPGRQAQPYGSDARPGPYDAEHRPYAPEPPASPHWPDGTSAGQPAAHGEPDGFDEGVTQTWQAPTWDTQYQPTIRRDSAPPQPEGHAAPQPGPYGAPQPGTYGAPETGSYGAPETGSYGAPQPGTYGAPESQAHFQGPGQGPQPHLQYQQPQAYQEPQGQQQYPQYQHYQQGQQPSPEPHQHQHQHPHPQEPYSTPATPAAADTAHLPPQGASLSMPLPPEAPAPAPVAPAPPVTPAPPVAPASASVAGAGPGSEGPAAQAGPDDTGYSTPTTLGNARITDAQRARAEGRSPIIAPGIQPAALTAVLGLLLAGGAAIGTYALLVPVVLLQAVTAAGWFRLNGMWPARQGIALAFAGGLVADVVLLAAGREHGPAALLGTLGVWVLLTVVLQLRSHAGADERMYGLMATVVSASLAVLAGGHLAAASDAVVVGGVAVAAATLVRALPLPGAASVAAALLAGAGGGLAVGALTDFGTKGALVGLVAGAFAVIGLRVASYDYPSRFVHMTAGVALPLTLAAPAVYLLGRTLL